MDSKEYYRRFTFDAVPYEKIDPNKVGVFRQATRTSGPVQLLARPATVSSVKGPGPQEQAKEVKNYSDLLKFAFFAEGSNCREAIAAVKQAQEDLPYFYEVLKNKTIPEIHRNYQRFVDYVLGDPKYLSLKGRSPDQPDKRMSTLLLNLFQIIWMKDVHGKHQHPDMGKVSIMNDRMNNGWLKSIVDDSGWDLSKFPSLCIRAYFDGYDFHHGPWDHRALVLRGVVVPHPTRYVPVFKGSKEAQEEHAYKPFEDLIRYLNSHDADRSRKILNELMAKYKKQDFIN